VLASTSLPPPRRHCSQIASKLVLPPDTVVAERPSHLIPLRVVPASATPIGPAGTASITAAAGALAPAPTAIVPLRTGSSARVIV
jgi:hypothetical protein